MRPQDESLTPVQQRVFSVVMLLITLAFSSVFAYAYWKGSQAQTRISAQPSSLARINRFETLRFQDIKRRAVRITRGGYGQEHPGQLARANTTPYNWTVSKFPSISESDPISIPPVIAYTASRNGWFISEQGVVYVPAKAETGIYLAHYCVGNQGHDYFFEVVSTPRSNTTSLRNISQASTTRSSSPLKASKSAVLRPLNAS